MLLGKMNDQRHRVPETESDRGSAAKRAIPEHSHKTSARAKRAADLYFAEGKSFRAAMLESGYSPSIAAQGPKYNLRRNVSLRRAFEAASHNHLRPEQLKMLAVHRLASEIANPKRTDGVKPIEVLGKMKDFDWFVRNADLQIGIFASLAEGTVGEGPPPDGARE